MPREIRRQSVSTPINHSALCSPDQEWSDDGDVELQQALAFFRAQPHFEDRAGEVIRRAFDEAIMGERRGRFAISELYPTEKAYIGLRVQLLFQGEFELSNGTKLDCKIAGSEIDIKFALTRTWTIPPEAVNELCLLVKADEPRARFSVGLMRMTLARLTEKGNRDGKRGVSAAGMNEISWVVREAAMPSNFFLELDPTVLERILGRRAGQARIDELFRSVQRRKTPRIAIPSLALQDDPMKRARDARMHLAPEQILILCGRYDREKARKLGFELSAREWVSIQLEKETYARFSKESASRRNRV